MQRGKILIVDDDPLIRDVLSSIFEMTGHYDTEIAGDGLASIEERDSYTKQHSERVTVYALRFGGYLHDIGKIGVQDTILLKPEEKNEINLHPIIGGNIIKPLQFFPKERELILHHHEHFNGSGYPDRLSGSAIPVGARILAVADAYDAMTSVRPYRRARPHDHAVMELKRYSRIQFDREVVMAFLQTLA